MENIVDISKYPKISSSKEALLLFNKISSQVKNLTKLQDDVLSDHNFFVEKRNVLIKGVAGSGKTLLPIAALMSNEKENRKMLYLVPYRALLNDKYMQFKQYFSSENKIYRSSSDYYEHDEDIFEGDCDIAVVIYEKLENYLRFNENSIQVFSKYDIIVFDELSVLSNLNRGLRVHFIINKYIHFINTFYGIKKARIIGLTVPQCNIPVYKDIDFYTYVSFDRPIKINECIYQADEQNFYPKENNHKWPFEIKFNVQENEVYAKKTILELDFYDYISNRIILERIILYHRKQGHNIIVFCNSKSATKSIAIYISYILRKSKLYCGDWSGELKKIKNNLDDNAYGIIDDKLLQCSKYGVAIHHSELPNSLRISTENEFRRKKTGSRINVLVSTETIAYGINCSADVVVVYNRTKTTDSDDFPRFCSTYGDFYWRYINAIEYQNYIGRAGRLGFKKNDLVSHEGYAYLISRDYTATKIIRNKYYNENKVDVYNCQQLFAKKLKYNTCDCVLNILDYITTNEEQKFEESDLETTIYNLTGQKNKKQTKNYIKVIISEMLTHGLIEEDAEQIYSITRRGEALRGKHLPNDAINKFKDLFYDLQTTRKYSYSKFLFIFELVEIVEAADFSIVSRKKDRLNNFSIKCIEYINSLLNNNELDNNAFDFLLKQAQNMQIKVSLLDTNADGFSFLSGDLSRVISKYSNAICMYEWSKGRLIEDICNTFSINVNIGYIQQLINSIIYIVDCYIHYIKHIAVNSGMEENLEKLKIELRLGIPYGYVFSSNYKFGVLQRPFVCKLIKNYEEEELINILESFSKKEDVKVNNVYEFDKALNKHLKEWRINQNEY